MTIFDYYDEVDPQGDCPPDDALEIFMIHAILHTWPTELLKSQNPEENLVGNDDESLEDDNQSGL